MAQGRDRRFGDRHDQHMQVKHRLFQYVEPLLGIIRLLVGIQLTLDTGPVAPVPVTQLPFSEGTYGIGRLRSLAGGLQHLAFMPEVVQ